MAGSPSQIARAISADLAMGHHGAAMARIMGLPQQQRKRVMAKITAGDARAITERLRDPSRRLDTKYSANAPGVLGIEEASRSPKAAACSPYTFAELDPHLSKEDRQAARDLRKSMMFIGEVADRLGVSKYRVDKLDESGELPHARKKYIKMNKGVWARVWLPSDVAEYAEKARSIENSLS